ncbi:protein kinase [Nocardioides sp. ChNu-153]|uniref:bifunctional serine/threonine-protein kinase/ABC transporter substrate-binding protein n=1 Tax=unclassified Nocardioides TaxID=2615069 RepID=UPI0024052A75|nr:MULTISPECIES: bifunctional serine/threonine-protein kinase/ABC transporter substrate-binding protein [unclassified Nocardioides]MDF9715448.1 protein kinase [Nocardioides sp. ChNu-99]MDN7120611.1 protein kinase [Nocardioides sp. ChNu-153]
MLEPGGVFGSYLVGDSIGHGGMGVVYRAVHRDLDREVALKVLAPQFSTDEEYRQRFLSEARTLARLESNHVVAIYDAGERDGSLFLAMQLVTDGDLATWLRAWGPMPPAMALDLLRQVTTGLAAAHAAGVLHRDIKASNVLLRRLPDGATRAYLCDFGIAQTQDSSLTRPGGVVGTWAYLAPERHQGAPASPATDVYALGCLLWAMLTGHAPYTGGTDVEVAIAHIKAPVPQLPVAGPAEHALNHLLARLLDKDPFGRPPSAAAVLEEVDRAAAVVTPGAGSGAGPVAAPAGDRTAGSTQAASYGGSPRRSRRGRWIAAAVAATVLAAGGIGAAVVLGDEPGGGGGGGGGEVPYADDTVPGVVDAPLSVTECDEEATGLRIGGLVPATGVLSRQAPGTAGGLGLAVSDINAAGGVLGEDVCHTVLDSGDGELLATLEDGGLAADAVVGPVESALAEAVVPYFEEEEVVHVTPAAYASDLSGVSPYSFRTIGEFGAMADALARLINDRARNAGSVAHLVAADLAAVRARDLVEERLGEAALTCAYGCTDAAQEIPQDATDLTAYAQAAVASGAEAAVVSGYMDGVALFTALEAAGWTGPIFLTSFSDDALAGAPAALLAETYSVFPAVVPEEEFSARVEEWYAEDSGGTVPTPFLAAESYDAVVLAALAATRGGATDGTTIAENMRAVSGSEGGTQCRTYRRCLALLEAGEEVVYRGVAVAGPFTEDHDLGDAWFSVFTFDETGEGTREDTQLLGHTD